MNLPEIIERSPAQHYVARPRRSLARKWSDWREIQLARQSLKMAGNPGLVLDLPCGAGQFWPMLIEKPNRVVMAADNTRAMLEVARKTQSPEVVAHINCFQTSASAIDLDSNAVDCILCMRLFHHLADSSQRLAILREMHRVTRDTLILSVRVEGSRAHLDRKTPIAGHRYRFAVNKDVIEGEFRASGFDILLCRGFIPGLSGWRFYTLRKKTDDNPLESQSAVGYFDHWWNLPDRRPDDPEEGGGGTQYVQGSAVESPSLVIKRQTGHECRSLAFPLGRSAILREIAAYHSYRELGIQVPELIFGGVRKQQGTWQALLVTEGLSHYLTLEDWYRIEAKKYWGETTHQRMLQRLARTLARLHDARWQHGCLYPKHIYIRVNNTVLNTAVDIALIELEKSRRGWRTKTVSERDLEQFYRHRGAMPEQDWAFFRRHYKHSLALARAI